MFDLASPWVLLLLPLPGLWRWFMPAAKSSYQSALKVPFFASLSQSKQKQMHLSLINRKMWLAFIIWCLLVFAASGPMWLGPITNLPRSGRDIILAVDLSGSMQIPDMQLNGHRADRLSVVKAAAKNFIRARKGDKLGLILFGTKAYLQTPLTFDRKTVLQMLDDATIGLAGTQTAIGDAIGLAIKRLSKAPEKSRVLILLTDGGNNAGVLKPLQAAKFAKLAHIKIYTIGIGAKTMLIQGVFGPQLIHPTSNLDEKTLKEVAKISGGLFFRANSAADLNKVYQSLNALMPVKSDVNEFRPKLPLYPWPLGLAFCLVLLLYLRPSLALFAGEGINNAENLKVNKI